MLGSILKPLFVQVTGPELGRYQKVRHFGVFLQLQTLTTYPLPLRYVSMALLFLAPALGLPHYVSA